jgi:N-acylneuraminate cytidylyltransferase
MIHEKNESLCVVIPFRFGQQDLPNKNIIKIQNVYLFQRSLNHALFLKSFLNLRICLSTNRPEVLSEIKVLNKILNHTKLSRGKKSDLVLSDIEIDVHKRSKRLSSKTSPISETLLDVRQSYKERKIDFQSWLLLQPTTPFRSKADIKTIIKFLSNETRKDYSLISLKTVDENHPARMYYIKNCKLNPFMGSDKLSRDRRQDLDPVYIRDGGFYLISDSLAKKGILFAKNPNYFLRQYPWNINIDSKYDLAAAKSISNLEVVDDPNSKSHDYKEYL